MQDKVNARVNVKNQASCPAVFVKQAGTSASSPPQSIAKRMAATSQAKEIDQPPITATTSAGEPTYADVVSKGASGEAQGRGSLDAEESESDSTLKGSLETVKGAGEDEDTYTARDMTQADSSLSVLSAKSDTGTLKSDTGPLKSNTGTLKSDTGTLKSDTGSLTAGPENITLHIKANNIKFLEDATTLEQDGRDNITHTPAPNSYPDKLAVLRASSRVQFTGLPRIDEGPLGGDDEYPRSSGSSRSSSDLDKTEYGRCPKNVAVKRSRSRFNLPDSHSSFTFLTQTKVGLLLPSCYCHGWTVAAIVLLLPWLDCCCLLLPWLECCCHCSVTAMVGLLLPFCH
jgi:hypothetical protein